MPVIWVISTPLSNCSEGLSRNVYCPSAVDSERVANEIGEVPVVVYTESDGGPVICYAVHVGAGAGVRTAARTIEIGELVPVGVYRSGLSSIREENQQAADCKGQ